MEERYRILQLHNNELKERLYKTEQLLEKKSEKIRQLLTELERLSEEKWAYKEQILECKSKMVYYESTPKKSMVKSHADLPTISHDQVEPFRFSNKENDLF